MRVRYAHTTALPEECDVLWRALFPVGADGVNSPATFESSAGQGVIAVENGHDCGGQVWYHAGGGPAQLHGGWWRCQLARKRFREWWYNTGTKKGDDKYAS